MAINRYKKQTDPRWNTHDFAGENINNAGCVLGLICNQTEETCSEDASLIPMADYLERNGMTCHGYGSYWEAVPFGFAYRGISCKQLNYSSLLNVKESGVFDKWKGAIKSGYRGGLLMGAGTSGYHWTNGGHYISVLAYDKSTDKYLVSDSANSARDGWHPWEHFAGSIKICYTDAYRWDGEQPTPTPEDFKRTGSGYCTENDVNLRATPGGAIIGRVMATNRFDVDGREEGGYTHINIATAGICWIATQYVRLDHEPTPKDNYVYNFTMKELKRGDKGKEVLLMEYVYKSLGIYKKTLDSHFGEGMEEAVKLKQKLHNLPVTGRVDKSTMYATFGLIHDGVKFYVKHIKKGSEGESVKLAQEILKSLDFYSGAIDGDFGKLTEQAVIDFQTAMKEKGLYDDEIDGNVGKKTWACLIGF